MARTLPPGPKTPVQSLLRFNYDPLGYLDSLGHLGPIFSMPVGRQTIFVLNDPELVKEMLVVKHRSFKKDRGIQVAKRLLGEGLLSSEGEFHKRQRRLVQPAFHRDRIAAYGKQMVDDTLRLRDEWRDGQHIDAAKAMNKLTLGIAGRTLFGSDVDADAEEIGQSITAALERFTILRVGISELTDRLPVRLNRLNRQWEQTRERLDKTMYRMINERRKSGVDNGDLLSMLLLATDTEGDGSSMSDLQLRDEAMTLFLAGHETTANALAWTWYLLAKNPGAESRMHSEIDDVLGGKPPTFADVKRLPYTEHVVAESMRIFPPAWTIGRLAAEDVEIGGYQVREGEMVAASQWLIHRSARYYDQPLRFNPDRWEPAVAATRPKFSYFPFGGGPRLCIGESFAWMEAVLVLATIAQEFRLSLASDARVTPTPRITLRPTPGIAMELERRRQAPKLAVG